MAIGKKQNDSLATVKFTKDSLIYLIMPEFFKSVKYEIKDDTITSGYGVDRRKTIVIFLNKDTFVSTYTDTLLKPNITYNDTSYRFDINSSNLPR